MEFFKFIFLFFFVLRSEGSVRASKLLLIFIDGFRWDYFDLPDVSLPGFQQIIQEGVRARYLISEFPTNDFPNMYSIMTGLHVESHGMVSNFMYDEDTGKKFILGGNRDSKLPMWWEGADPLWITAEKQKKRAYFYDWPRCDVTINGTKITYCKPKTKVTYPEDLVLTLSEGLNLLKNDSADLVGLSLVSPDEHGHRFGAVSDELKQGLRDADVVMQEMMSNLTSMGLKDKVNIMLFSDHGMADRTSVVSLINVIDPDDWTELLDSMNIVRIWPKAGKLEKIIQDIEAANLSGVAIYRKEDLPNRWHLKGHPRTPPLLVIGNKGQYLVTSRHPSVPMYSTGPMVGMHGFDNTDTEMRAMFVATGPDFKKNKITEPIHNVELYQIMCYILDLTPSPHNGTWSNVKDMLVLDTSMATKRSTHALVLITLFGTSLYSLITTTDFEF